MTRNHDARQQMQVRAQNKAAQHLIGATVHAVAAENHFLARSLVSVAAEQAQLWLLVQAMTSRVAAHVHIYQEDTLNGLRFWAEDGLWTFEDVTDMDGPVAAARTAAARLVTTILYANPADASTWEAEWTAIWDAAADTETVALVAAAMLAQTYPELRVPTP